MKTKTNKHNEMKTQFAANDKGVLTDAGALVVGKELSKLERKYGAITPELVVKEAEPEDSVLHKYFQWDDTKAAEAWRLSQARQIIRSVIVISAKTEASEPQFVRAFVNVNSVEGEDRFSGRVYRSTVRALKEDAYRSQVLEKAYQELVAWQTRYKHLEEFTAIINAIEELEVVES